MDWKSIFRTSGMVLLVFLALSSCTSRKVFSEYHKFSNFTWNRFELITFDVPIEDEESLYEIAVAVRHIPQFPYGNLDINMTINSPDGEMRSGDFSLKLKDKNGKWLGDGMGDLYDIEIPVHKGMKFSGKGLSRIEIENKMDKYEIRGIMEVGLVVRKVKETSSKNDRDGAEQR
jgi:gliding motility-associated lipoprotein GldH